MNYIPTTPEQRKIARQQIFDAMGQYPAARDATVHKLAKMADDMVDRVAFLEELLKAKQIDPVEKMLAFQKHRVSQAYHEFRMSLASRMLSVWLKPPILLPMQEPDGSVRVEIREKDLWIQQADILTGFALGLADMLIGTHIRNPIDPAVLDLSDLPCDGAVPPTPGSQKAPEAPSI